jgi:hypothetical protein
MTNEWFYFLAGFMAGGLYIKLIILFSEKDNES